MNNKQVSIRFLKQGLLHMEVAENSNIEDIRQLAKNLIDNTSDQDLVMAMSDCTPSGPNPTRFDSDSFQVEAIEDEEFNLLYATSLWEAYLNE